MENRQRRMLIAKSSRRRITEIGNSKQQKQQLPDLFEFSPVNKKKKAMLSSKPRPLSSDADESSNEDSERFSYNF